MTPNSATIFANQTKRPYSDTGADNGKNWIQSPISHQVFAQGGQIVAGMYVQVKPFEVTLPIPEALRQEFAAWDAASDEALINFERENL